MSSTVGADSDAAGTISASMGASLAVSPICQRSAAPAGRATLAQRSAAPIDIATRLLIRVS